MRAILMAPTTAAILINPLTAGLAAAGGGNAAPTAGTVPKKKESLEKWIPPPQAKPKERQLVRRVRK